MRDQSSLVEGGVRRYGRFAARPTSVNPLDEYDGLSRALRRLRLKEWIGFTLIHPDWYSSLIMQDANYLASSEIYAYDRRTRVLRQHAANARGGSLALPQNLAGAGPRFTKDGYLLEYEFSADGKRHRIRLDIKATPKAPAFSGELELHGDRASWPLSVSSRLAGGKLYTHKALFPAEGVLRVGATDIVFDPTRDLAIIDEHKSFFPYRTNWLWGTFASQAGARPVGANFATRKTSPGEEEESCIWTPQACEPLADVTFTPTSGNSLSPWHIASRDGRLDVTFEPEGRKDVRHQLGLFSIDYFQLFGHYRGTLRGADGTRYPVDSVHGVCESFRARL
jgi:hypothetical protein